MALIEDDMIKHYMTVLLLQKALKLLSPWHSNITSKSSSSEIEIVVKHSTCMLNSLLLVAFHDAKL